ncbi:MAG: DEAD/DEAH box helicase family protein [Pseudomonadota bacterium]
MKIKFDGHQQFQIDAVNAVCDIFKSQPLASAVSSISFAASPGELFDELGVANNLVITQEKILENLREVQKSQGLHESFILDGMNFSVEMETGTGKTYVYLRTVYELNARYGFKKFVIVVPTVAIREGVKKSIEITRSHFSDFYGKIPCETWVYDSAHLSRLRQFAASNQLQILIVNIDAFNKAVNVINKEQDKLSGRKPIEFLRACRPIVIIDEPQNVESELASQAIESLSPTCTLRYSATHRKLYNPVYRLDPVRAYDLRLVKRIEVDSVLDEENFNKPFIAVERIEPSRSKVTAKLMLDVMGSTGPVRKTVRVSRNGVDLFDVSGERDAYRGYIVDEIDAGNGYVSFTNGVVISQGESQGGSRDDVMKAQVRETVREHLEKELTVRKTLPEGRRLKILSLFFIDRVANYVPAEGKIRKWFVAAYGEFSSLPRFKDLGLPSVEAVHGGYFSETKGQARDTSGDSAADDDAYTLIMRDKERLLSLEEPLRFIFSHSALREGWDNPNVFQICTLNETVSEVKKRQEIGRGLRLPVDESGERCIDARLNTLTVIANESYEKFAAQLQTEIEDECGVRFEGRIANKRERRKATLRKGWRLDTNFLGLWERIKHKTRYSVSYSTDELIAIASERIAQMPAVARAKIVTKKAKLEIDKTGVVASLQSTKEATIEDGLDFFPDALGYLQRETELTRATIARILIESGRLEDLLVDPQEFLDKALGVLRTVMQEFMVHGVKYERIDGAEYEMYLFEQQELDGYLSRMLEVRKSIYDLIEYDSDVERKFAEELDSREDILLFVKLPRWFKVNTPVGSYNPDWAVVKQEEDEAPKLYLVRETKGTVDELRLRGIEWAKIRCGKAHFSQLGVDYKHVTSAAEV